MEIIKYPDGTSYAKGTYGFRKPNITYKINSYEDLWHLGQIVDVLNHQGIKPTITIPNLIDAQADRRFNDDESTGLKLVCKFLNSMNATFRIFHPHNPEVVEALMDNVEIIDNSEYIKKVINTHIIQEGDDIGNLILMSSDAGGFKPLMKLCDKLSWKGDTFSASKSRGREMGETILIQQVDKKDFKGKDILIIDDISVFGGTFKNLAKLLREKNCGKIYLAISHMTVQNLGGDPVTDYYDKVFTTNSKFDNYFKQTKDGGTQPDNLEIIKMF